MDVNGAAHRRVQPFLALLAGIERHIKKAKQDGFMTASLVSRRLRRTALVALAFGAVFGAATGLQAQDAPADLVVATLNGAPISQSDLAAAAAEFADQLGQVPAEQRQTALLEIIVNMRLAAAAAKAEGLDKNPLVVKRVTSGQGPGALRRISA